MGYVMKSSKGFPGNVSVASCMIIDWCFRTISLREPIKDVPAVKEIALSKKRVFGFVVLRCITHKRNIIDFRELLAASSSQTSYTRKDNTLDSNVNTIMGWKCSGHTFLSVSIRPQSPLLIHDITTFR